MLSFYIMKNKILIIAIFILICSGAAGYHFYFKKPASQVNQVASVPIPDLNRPIVFYADLPEDAKQIARQKIEESIMALKENPDLFNEWLALGVYRKIINDYEAAREIWEYAGYIRPMNGVSFANLGDLYAFYLKDNVKAEQNFLKALENDTSNINLYRSIYEFYRYAMNDEKKAKDILKEGIEANPDSSVDLKYLLANFYSL